MSEDRKNSSSIGAIQANYAIGAAVKELTVSREIYQLGAAVKSILGITQTVLGNKEFLKFTEIVGRVRFNVVRELATPNSEIGKTFKAINELNLALNHAAVWPDSDLNKALMSIGKIGEAWKATAPKVMSNLIKEHYELYGLIRSGQISLDQISSGVEEAISRGEALDVNDGPVTEEHRSDALKEIITAFLSAGSLKGNSSPSLQFFIAFVIVLTWVFAALNQGFELQKNFSDNFTSAKTPAEARSLARHPPVGVDKEKLVGFRVLVGDRVSLREGPSQKYLSTKQLPIGALLQVLDASEKSWLMVSVVEDGEIYEGWVLRGYTKPIR
ncbi:SH3 domain-containing protein [Pseudomonas sp. SWRI111]|uniref:SH3 domain-containing protein n=1 Tax=Pseudomonas sp. SWRI111 TaxID=2745507 RepID=UPI001646AB76|nr:SH3 domain-containing protein [Pseudomonas sp. SWRI111]MBC3209880.1 SH3 domain-containing protein [Pseudomonas sp. SWRI111]